MNFLARASSRRNPPPSSPSLPNRPSTRFASVTVGLSPSPVTNWPRFSARALRPDAQRSAAVESRQRPASRAHSMNLQHRHRHRQIGDNRFIRRTQRAFDQRYVRRRAAHIEADRPRIARALCQLLRPQHAARRTRKYRPHRFPRRHLRRKNPPARLHHPHARPRLPRASPTHTPGPMPRSSRRVLLDVAEIPAHHRHKVSIQDSRSGAFEFAEFGQNFVRHGNVHSSRAQSFRKQPFVLRPQKRKQQANSNRIGSRAAHATHDPCDLGLRRTQQHPSIRTHALAHSKSSFARHQRRRPRAHQRIELRSRLPPNFQHVLESRCRHQRHAPAPAFQQRVRAHGGAAKHFQRLSRVAIGRFPGDSLQRDANRTRRIPRRRRNLQNFQPPAAQKNAVRKRPAGVERHAHGRQFYTTATRATAQAGVRQRQ